MTQHYYECHITLKGVPGDLLKRQVESYHGWKFSAIDGDPTLGQSVFCYATKHYNAKHELDYVIERMHEVATELAGKAVVEEVIREKVELVVYDTKHKAKG